MRNRVCNKKKGELETCFGDWVELDSKGRDKHKALKEQTATCNEVGCPGETVRRTFQSQGPSFPKG